jgi:hypothetical protein
MQPSYVFIPFHVKYNDLPSTPIDKLRDISSHLGALLHHLQNGQDSKGTTTLPADVRELIQCFWHQQTAINEMLNTPSPPTNTITPPSTNTLSEYFTNAKFEDIICRPIKPLYNGTADNLVPFLNRLDIRHQDKAWGSITYISIATIKYDLLKHFAKINESEITQEAKFRWTRTTVNKDKHQPQHLTFHSRILAKLLLCFLTDNFSMTIINRIPSDLRNDGPLFL